MTGKHLIYFILIFTLLSTSVFAQVDELFLEINGTGDQKGIGRLAGGAYFEIGQSFNYTNLAPGNKVAARINLTTTFAANVGICRVLLYNATTDYPIEGEIVAISENFTCNTLGLKSINFTNSTNLLVSGMTYTLVINTTQSLAANTLSYFTYSNAGFGGGSQVQKQSGGSWVIGDPGYDIFLDFYVRNYTAPAPGDTLNITSTVPNNNSQYNIDQISINATIESDNTFTCELLVNNTVNTTFSNQAAGVGTVISANLTFVDGVYDYFYNCTDGTTAETSTVNIFYVDTINPTISTNFVNNKIYLNDNLTGQFNFSDSQSIFSINITVDDTNVLFDENNILNTSYDITINSDVRSYGVGNHTLNVKVADGHTALKIPAFDVDKSLLGNSITYSRGDTQVLVNPLEMGSFTTNKLTDRYTFTHQPTFNHDFYEYEIESNKKIYIVNAGWTKEKTWVITGDKWIDFYTPEQKNAVVTFTKVNDNKVIARVSGLTNKNIIEYHSIGELNIVQQDYYFAISNGTVTYTNPNTDNTIQTISLRINKTNLITETNANLTWNGTSQTVTKTIGSTFDLFDSTFLIPDIGSDATAVINWSYEIKSNTTTEIGNINATQDILNINVNNCTAGNVSINISIYQEQSPSTLTVADVDLWINYSVNNNTARVNFSNAYSGSSNYLLCIDPANASLINADVLADFNAPTFDRSNYWIRGLIVNGSSNYPLNLYLVNETASSQVNIFLSDQNGNVLQDWLIQVQNFDPATNTFRTIEVLKTDVNGQVVANLVKFIQRYKFVIIDKDGNVREIINQEEIYLDDIFLRVNLQQDVIGFISDLNKVTGIVDYDNATNIFSFTFNDGLDLITGACLEVYQRDVYGETLYGQNCMNGVSGSLTVSIAGETEGIFIGVGKVNTTDPDLPIVVVDTLEFSFNDDFSKWGLLGLLLTAFICFTLFAAGMWNPAVAVVSLILALIVTWLLGISSLGVTSVMVLAFIGGIIIFKLKT